MSQWYNHPGRQSNTPHGVPPISNNTKKYSEFFGVFFGGFWDTISFSGSCCSYWNQSPSVSDIYFSTRGVSDHWRKI